MDAGASRCRLGRDHCLNKNEISTRPRKWVRLLKLEPFPVSFSFTLSFLKEVVVGIKPTDVQLLDCEANILPIYEFKKLPSMPVAAEPEAQERILLG